MIQLILTDIEGTTTSVSFVYETLFPYFSKNIEQLLVLKNTNNEVKECFDNIKKLVLDEESKVISDNEVLEILLKWVKIDRKETNLKKLQGIMWNEGYKSCELKGHVYADVMPNLRKWNSLKIKVAVYSSGSIAAQKLIFGYSEVGDLTPYFVDYFDTTIGHKREVESYNSISNKLKIAPENILFLSDIEEELDAASAANYNVLQLVRPGTKKSEKYNSVTSFDFVVV